MWEQMKGVILLILGSFLCFSFAAAAERSSDLVFDERLESTGYDEVFLEADFCESGNVIYPDASTSALENPTGWGNEFCYLKIGNENGGALSRTQLTAPASKLYSRIEFILIEDEMENGKIISLAVAKSDYYSDVDWPVAWSLHIGKGNGIPYVFVRMADRAAIHKYPIKVGQRYIVEIEYNPSDAIYSVYLNGMKIGSGDILASDAQEITWLILGSTFSSTGHNISVGLDNYLHSEIGWPIVPLE